jgi:hypothetical protein
MKMNDVKLIGHGAHPEESWGENPEGIDGGDHRIPDYARYVGNWRGDSRDLLVADPPERSDCLNVGREDPNLVPPA